MTEPKKTPAQILAEVKQQLEASAVEAVQFGRAHSLEYVVSSADDFTPFRTNGTSIRLFGGTIYSTPSRETAYSVANDLTRAAIRSGSKLRPTVMIAQAWAARRMTALQELSKTLAEQVTV